MNEATAKSSFLAGLLQNVADRGRALVGLRRVEAQGVEQLLALAQKLLTGRGEASGVAIARAILGAYSALSGAQKVEFLKGLAARFGADMIALGDAARAFLDQPGDAEASDRKSTRLNSSHLRLSRMPSSA